jgi:uncharacterized protein
MPAALSVDQRQKFLSAARIGVLAVASERPDRAPVTAPIWYTYTPGGDLLVITGKATRKGRAIEAARRFSMTVQEERLPYRYVMVEGPVVEIRAVDLDADLAPMAVRYLGEEVGRAYAQDWLGWGGAESDLVYVIKPQYWNTADLSADLEKYTVPAAD